MLRNCQERNKNANVEDKVKKIVEGSIADLSEFGDESFDAVLCLGTLSHFIHKWEREKAVCELVRVTKKKTPIFVSVINRYGVFRVILQRFPNELTASNHEETFSAGIHHAHYIHPLEPIGGFTDAYFFLPNELRELFEKEGVQTLDMATCEGLSSHLQEATNAIYNDPVKWNRWLKILLQTCTDPCIIGLGEHLLYVGRRKT